MLILTYHRFDCGRHPSRVSTAEFRAHLEYLGKYNRVISLSEAIGGISGTGKLPKNPVVITIDDGYEDAYQVARPLLLEYGFPATVYAVTDFLDGKCWLWTDKMRYCVLNTKKGTSIYIDDLAKAQAAGLERKLALADRLNSSLKLLSVGDRETRIKEIADDLEVEIPPLPTPDYAPLSWSQAREADAAGVRIESHSVTHPLLANVAEEVLTFELQASKERLENALGRRLEHFCFPNGSYNSTAKRLAKDAGYRSAVTTDYGFNSNGADLFGLQRIDAPKPIENFAQSVSGFEMLRIGLKRV